VCSLQQGFRVQQVVHCVIERDRDGQACLISTPASPGGVFEAYDLRPFPEHVQMFGELYWRYIETIGVLAAGSHSLWYSSIADQRRNPHDNLALAASDIGWRRLSERVCPYTLMSYGGHVLSAELAVCFIARPWLLHVR
jgi:hypothetical protein